ncbi:MAG: hypothetical protein BGO77_06085 [Caedibacter sp. 37-49]|nr:MAG: hypothetical protein BGO77_06085 [Caedibacter sp. 37-49]
MKKNIENNKHELQLLIKGFNHFKLKNIKTAISFFTEAISAYGSPLGYLYAGTLSSEEGTSKRYLNIAQLAVKNKALPKEVFDQHVEFLVRIGLLTKS